MSSAHPENHPTHVHFHNSDRPFFFRSHYPSNFQNRTIHKNRPAAINTHYYSVILQRAPGRFPLQDTASKQCRPTRCSHNVPLSASHQPPAVVVPPPAVLITNVSGAGQSPWWVFTKNSSIYSFISFGTVRLVPSCSTVLRLYLF